MTSKRTIKEGLGNILTANFTGDVNIIVKNLKSLKEKYEHYNGYNYFKVEICLKVSNIYLMDIWGSRYETEEEYLDRLSSSAIEQQKKYPGHLRRRLTNSLYEAISQCHNVGLKETVRRFSRWVTEFTEDLAWASDETERKPLSMDFIYFLYKQSIYYQSKDHQYYEYLIGLIAVHQKDFLLSRGYLRLGDLDKKHTRQDK